MAISFGYKDAPEMTLELIKHGAIVTEKTQDGTDALYYAKEKGKTPSVLILEKYTNK